MSSFHVLIPQQAFAVRSILFCRRSADVPAIYTCVGFLVSLPRLLPFSNEVRASRVAAYWHVTRPVKKRKRN